MENNLQEVKYVWKRQYDTARPSDQQQFLTMIAMLQERTPPPRMQARRMVPGFTKGEKARGPPPDQKPAPGLAAKSPGRKSSNSAHSVSTVCRHPGPTNPHQSQCPTPNSAPARTHARPAAARTGRALEHNPGLLWSPGHCWSVRRQDHVLGHAILCVPSSKYIAA